MDHIRKGEIPFKSLLLPPLLSTFVGFTEPHLESITGNRLNDAVARSVKFWVDRGMIDFYLTTLDSKKPNVFASIKGGVETKIRDPYSFFNLITYKLDPESDQERGIRLFWSNHRFNTPPGEDVNDLFINEVQVLPQEGELYESRGNKFVQPRREKQLKLGEFGGQDMMHVLNLVTLDGGRTYSALDESNRVYKMVEVTLTADGTYEIRVSADGTVFQSSFSLTLPKHIRLDQKRFSETLSLL